jgi:hypothetical protein
MKPLFRSVYLHKLGNEFHAHVYSKYPLRVNPSCSASITLADRRQLPWPVV